MTIMLDETTKQKALKFIILLKDENTWFFLVIQIRVFIGSTKWKKCQSIFVFQKHGKCWSISLEHFIKKKPSYFWSMCECSVIKKPKNYFLTRNTPLEDNIDWDKYDHQYHILNPCLCHICGYILTHCLRNIPLNLLWTHLEKKNQINVCLFQEIWQILKCFLG